MQDAKLLYVCRSLMWARDKENTEGMVESLFEFEAWSAEQDINLYLQQLALFNVSVEGWIINSSCLWHL